MSRGATGNDIGMVRGPQTGFKPTRVSGCVGWWKSDTGVTLSSASVSNDTAATWTVVTATRATGQTDPAGGTSAIKLTDTVDASPQVHYIVASPANLVDGPHLFDFWAKAGTLNFIRIRYGGTTSAIYIDLQNAIVSEVSSGAVRGTLLSGTAGGWQHWRVEFLTTSAVASISMQLAQTGTGAGSNYQGDGTGTVFIGTGTTYGPKLYQDRVSQWNDQSGNGYNGTQATAGSQMLYQELDSSGNWVPTGDSTTYAKRIGWPADAGKNFDLPAGVASLFSGTNKPVTVLAVATRNITITASFAQGFHGGGGSTQTYAPGPFRTDASQRQVAAYIDDTTATIAETNTNVTTTNTASYGSIYDGTNQYLWIDGIGAPANPKTMSIGTITLTTARIYAHGYTIREVVVFNRALSDKERIAVTNGMRKRQHLSPVAF